MSENPYEPPTSIRDQPGTKITPSLVTKALLVVAGVCVLLLFLLFVSMNIFFTLNPGVLQSGNSGNPATFESDDVAALVLWCAIWLGLAWWIVVLLKSAWRSLSRRHR